MIVLGIESSCDETAAAITKDGRQVLSNVIYSQADIHAKFGGVVPEVASRRHIEKILWVIDSALKEAEMTKDDIDAIAVSNGPGLVGALLIGVSAAKALSYAWNKPLVPVCHIHGHIAANYITFPDLEPPFVCLVASGGHSHIVEVEDYGTFRVLGATRDDAAGEAFDKVARVLGLGYPGGPKIDAAAKDGNVTAFNFPRAKSGADFSFSGLKTAVINQIHNMEQKSEPVPIADLAASFQQAVVDVLVDHTISAARERGVTTVCLAGGVASNTALRAQMKEEAEKFCMRFCCPPPVLCTDNAAMVSSAGYFNARAGISADLTLNAEPGMTL